ncbi:hypothetical protein ONZ51_g12567 [Trametes cubensis]|uniref:Uncharacterized protein n=1 Tax=Trametes cubensis TaxID=1111947 RepID=A0AAD7X4S7_9APHY|nr:hypothetical protein ONZ51_g12567 [Trametes cubensis]
MAFLQQALLQTDGVPPPRVLPKEVEFPANTVITLTDSNLNYMRRQDLAWEAFTSPVSPGTPASIQDVPEGAMAFIRCDNDVFEWWQYRKITGGQWKFVDAQLSELNGSTYISALSQEEYNVQHADPLEVDYHATRLEHLRTGEAVVCRPDEPAYDVNIIANEKRTIRYCFTDCTLPTPRQQRLRTKDKHVAKTRRELAGMVVQDLSATLLDLEKTGKTLHHNGRPVKFEDIILLSVVFCSKGTMRPRLAVVCEKSNLLELIEQLISAPLLPHDVL